MPQLDIRITTPADQTRLAGSGVLRLTAALQAAAPVPLFFKWYSSAAADPVGTALDVPAANLPLGSQVLTFSAKDQAADTAAALFGEDSYWRDLVSFTWNLRTEEGRGAIHEMLAARLADVQPSNFQLQGDATEAAVGGVAGVAGAVRVAGGTDGKAAPAARCPVAP